MTRKVNLKVAGTLPTIKRSQTGMSPDTGMSAEVGVPHVVLRSELVVILPDYALRISLGTFSILLFTTTHVPLLVDKLSPRVLVG